MRSVNRPCFFFSSMSATLSLVALSLVALLQADCTSMPPDVVNADLGGEDLSSTGGGPRNCTSCTDGQVCVEGACVEVPKSCPCPKETYCDLAVSQCKVGCTNDNECSTGRICDDAARSCHTGCRKDEACGSGMICDNTLCRAGCRKDGDCGSGNICDTAKKTCVKGCRKDTDCTTAGQICDTMSNTCQKGCRKDTDCGSGMICDTAASMCRTGCRTTATCPNEQICDTAANKCVAGCDTDARCNTGRICDKSMCTDGCRTSATCALNTYCDTTTTKKCVPGCNHDKTRCAAGEACVNYVDGSSKCQANCYGYDCNGTNWECYTQTSDYAGARCRQTCTTDGDCPTMGHRCTWFTERQATPGSYSVRYCAQPCTTAGCTTCVDSYGMFGNGVCNTTTKACTYLSMYTCYQTSPSYGL